MRLLGGQRPEITDVAKELGMSCRTLQRRIAEESTSFRQLVCDARRELAKHYLFWISFTGIISEVWLTSNQSQALSPAPECQSHVKAGSSG